jgi:phage tail-like protein
MVFEVTVQTTNGPVQAGNSFEVTVSVDNTANMSDTQDVILNVGGTQRDVVTVDLGANSGKTVTLVWNTGVGDAGVYEFAVSSNDTTDTGDVTVEEAPQVSFDVTIDWTNGPVTAGEPLCVDCTATNTGSEAGERTVAVGLGSQVDPKKKTKLALAPGESGTVHLSVEQGEYREGNDAEYEKKLWAETGTDRAETTVSVKEPPHFAVDIQSTNAPVEAGETLEVTVEVENTGGQTGHETVALAAKEYVNSISNAGSIRPGGGEDRDAFIDTTTKAVAGGNGGGTPVVDSTGVELAPEGTHTATVEWGTGPTTDAVDPGDYALGVAAIPPWERDEWDGPVFGRACTDGTRTDATVVTIQHGPMRTGRFKIELDGEELVGPARVNLPARSTEQDSYKEDGDDETEWGRTSFDDLSMSRGVKPGDTRLHDWHEAVEEGNVDQGRKEIAVKLLDEEGNPMIQWELQEAWPKNYDPPELDAGGDSAVAQEEITIAYEKYKRVS